MDDNRLWNLIQLCIPLSLVSFGGGQSIVAGLQHQAVDIQHFVTARQFTDFYAISRSAPGPGTLIVGLIGWNLSGLMGALAATLAIFLPSSMVVCVFGSFWHRHRDAAWAIAVEKGLAPVAAGLIFAGAFTVVRSAGFGWIEGVTTLAATVILMTTKFGAYPILGVVGLGYFLLSFNGFI
jgi:chromate transporter